MTAEEYSEMRPSARAKLSKEEVADIDWGKEPEQKEPTKAELEQAKREMAR